MTTDFSIVMRFVLCALGVWRLTHLIVAEDGPWNLVVRLRARLGDSELGRGMDCFYCSSVWLAIPFTFVVASRVLDWFIAWLALSATASLLQQATNRNMNRAHSSTGNSGGKPT
jgi:hypothetical protein